MKKTLYYIIAIFGAAILVALFAYDSAAAQEYYYDGGYSVYDFYGTGGYGSFDSYGYNADGCGVNCGASYISFDYSSCGASCFGGASFGCGSFCGGFGFGGFGGAAFLPPVYVPPRHTPPVAIPPVYVPPVIQPPTYIPPVYVPPTYNPPTYLPPVYVPPTYNPPPVYLPPIVVPPPVIQPPVCTIRFSNFNPPLVATEGQLYAYNLQSISTGPISNQISYRLVTGPDGMVVAPNGQIVWTPAFNQSRARAYTVTVAAYNGTCENAQTFYITVSDMNPVPPVVHPKPKPVCGCECTNTCTKTVTTCTTTTTKVTTTCPPDAPMAVGTVDGGNTTTGFGIGSAISAAIAGLTGAILAVLYSPWLLLAVILILAILLIRAYQRTRAMKVSI